VLSGATAEVANLSLVTAPLASFEVVTAPSLIDFVTTEFLAAVVIAYAPPVSAKNSATYATTLERA
jgi:hypothetical protein